MRVREGDSAMPETIIGLFDDFSEAQEALQELTESGIPRDEISVVASSPPDEEFRFTAVGPEGDEKRANSGVATGAAAGATVGAGLGLLAGITSLFLPGLGPIVAAGWIATTVGMTVVGAAAGGLLGALTGAGVPEEQAGYFVE